MAKPNKRYKEITKYRNDGMVWALKIVRESGIPGLEKEIRMRKSTYSPLELSKEWLTQILDDIFTKIHNSYNVAIWKVLNESFGFGEKRLKQFENDFNEVIKDISSIDKYGERVYTLSDYAKLYNDRFNANFDMEKIAKVDALYNDGNVSMKAVEELLVKHGFNDAADFLIEYMEG